MPVDYPSAVARQSADRRDAWFQSHVTTVLQRDVRDLANVADTTAFRGCFSVVAIRLGGLLNFADLSRTMALPQKTLKRYVALLEATFLVQLLRPCSRNMGQRAIQTPKVYLNEIGLLAHLLGVTVDHLNGRGMWPDRFWRTLCWWSCASDASGARPGPNYSIGGRFQGAKLGTVLNSRW
jgi:predicted AAA+ superfamily ATPase